MSLMYNKHLKSF